MKIFLFGAGTDNDQLHFLGPSTSKDMEWCTYAPSPLIITVNLDFQEVMSFVTHPIFICFKLL